MSSTTALVIGAGIAGPAVAIALRRAGIEAVVYEGSETPRDDEGAMAVELGSEAYMVSQQK